ncbi:MAG TPA: hypothetical protein VGQ59_06970 [Cyclobacteriaceae bacterium]|jgi:hypothetical protein|nr:hypothetical protein [Cyclobacteriaceae bacterium]
MLGKVSGRVFPYILNFTFVRFFNQSTAINQLVILVGGVLSIPWLLHGQLFDLLNLLSSIVKGEEINLPFFIAVLGETAVLFYILVQFMIWERQDKTIVSKTKSKDFSTTADFIFIDRYIPPISFLENSEDEDPLWEIIKNSNLVELQDAIDDPVAFMKTLRPMTDAISEMTKEINGNDPDDIGTGSLFELMEKQIATENLN